MENVKVVLRDKPCPDGSFEDFMEMTRKDGKKLRFGIVRTVERVVWGRDEDFGNVEGEGGDDELDRLTSNNYRIA
jgi:hypothetical protein